MTTCVSPVTHGDARSTTTPPNGKSAWSKSGRKSPAPCVPSPAPNTSATYGPTSPPPPNTASISSRHSSNSHPAGRGYPTSTDLISYLLRQVDGVIHAVEPEFDSPVGVAAVEVIGQHGNDLLGH